jgi:hypothetical protein
VLRSREGRIGQRPEPIVLATRFEFTARRDMRDMMSARLRDGWRRVHDPDHDADLDAEPREPRDAGFIVDDRAIAPAFAWREPQQKTNRYTSVNE